MNRAVPANRSAPASRNCSIREGGTGSVKVSWKACSRGQSIPTSFPPSTSTPSDRRAKSTARAASSSTFLLLQPHRAQVPPNFRRSTAATVLLRSFSPDTTVPAAGPLPITTTS